jgi:transcriptional regulator with XRE-family HTH domain
MSSSISPLRARRIQLGLTMKDIAEKVGVSVNSIRLLETNRLKPRDELIPKYAKIYRIEEDKLYQMLGKIPPSIIKELKSNETLYRTLSQISSDTNLSQDQKTQLYKCLAQQYTRILQGD